MKTKSLLSALLLLPLALSAAVPDAVKLTFHRTGLTPSMVQVSVVNQDGQPLDGVSAQLQDVSFDSFKQSGAEAISDGSVLAPDTYANKKDSQISFLFRIEGLPADFTFDSADIDVYALNAGGTAQYNTGNTVRYFQFEVATGATADVGTFAVKHIDTDICTVPDQDKGLFHSIQTMTATGAATATNPLYLRVTLIKTSDLGCYAGIGAVTLYTQGGGTEPQPAETFSADKFYTIHRNGNTSAYIYQSGGYMATAQLDASKPFWWVLEPTGNPNCYYIKNATTGKYVQSSAETPLSTLVPIAGTPVEFQIKKDETPGANTKGFYYLASTDQTVSVDTDGSLGLNFGASGVVSYYIKTGRGNSYWQIEEGDYAYNPPVVEATAFARSIQLYSIPCGASGNAYLSAADIEGPDVLAPLHYSAKVQPGNYYTLHVGQKASVRQGGILPIALAVANAEGGIRTFAYADWDKDGVFEESRELSDGMVSFNVPLTADIGQYRIRIRVTETDTEGAEDDVIGACYDFLVNVVPSSAAIVWNVEVNDPERGTVHAEVVADQLHLEATPLGDAFFVGWKLMRNHCQGEIISSEATADIPLTQSMRIVAVFTPNTQPIPVAVHHVHTAPDAKSEPAAYDLAGRKSSPTAKGVVIASGRKRINK